MCCALTGEIGRMLRHLLEDEGVTVAGVGQDRGRGSAYVHDRRGGERQIIAETEGDPLARHDLDELYGVTLREGLASGLTILSGPAGDEALPADTYRRLAADLREPAVPRWSSTSPAASARRGPGRGCRCAQGERRGA